MSSSQHESRSTRKAVILAAGAGSRMRRGDPDLIDPENREAAREGLKGLIRFHDRPFIDYVIQYLIDAGLDDICLVISAARNRLWDYYEALAEALTEAELVFAIQDEPLGTAHALLSAETFTGEEPFVIVNCDNLYPVETLRTLKEMPPPALTLFDREGLLRGNIPPERLADMSLVETDEEGCLTRMIEKPGREESATFDSTAAISMNSWHFGPEIYDACRVIPPHPVREEYELPSAALHLMTDVGCCLRTARFSLPVYDLTSIHDVTAVEEMTRAIPISLPTIMP